MNDFRLWLGNGDHTDFQAPEIDENPGCTAFFPTDSAESTAPPGAMFVAAVAWSFGPGSERPKPNCAENREAG